MSITLSYHTETASLYILHGDICGVHFAIGVDNWHGGSKLIKYEGSYFLKCMGRYCHAKAGTEFIALINQHIKRDLWKCWWNSYLLIYGCQKI